MSLKTQAKILRILQEQSFERVGGNELIMVDVRVIAATNKDLTKEIKKGNFREDLYYRLNVIPFHVPPLRERKDDIPLFVDFYIKDFSSAYGKRGACYRFGAAQAALTNYDWPGNVRELKNLIERLIIMVPSGNIEISDIPDYIRNVDDGSGVFRVRYRHDLYLKRRGPILNVSLLSKKLAENNGNISKTAEADRP